MPLPVPLDRLRSADAGRPEDGEVAAIVAAVLLRLVWLVSESVFGAIVYVGVKGPSSNVDEST